MVKTGSLRFSIVVPSFNQGQFIGETIDSILSQDYPNTEIIVMDGGSTDNTVEILKSYGPRIQWVSQKDKGQAHALNMGLRKANGSIVAFLNSDDYYIKGAFEAVSVFFSRNPQRKWVTGDYYIINGSGKRMFSFVIWYKKLWRAFPTLFTLSITNFMIQPSTFWRRELLDEIGFFNEDLHYAMDYDYWLRIMKKYQLSVIRKPLSAFRIHGGSKGGASYKKEFETDLGIITTHCDNKFLLKLHALHNWAIIKIYDHIK